MRRPSPLKAEIVGRAHDAAAEMIRAAQLHGCAPLVRVPSLDESAILRALDLGPAGVVIPQVQSSEDVRRVIEYSKYPPIGQRGHSPFTRSNLATVLPFIGKPSITLT